MGHRSSGTVRLRRRDRERRGGHKVVSFLQEVENNWQKI